MVAAKKHAAASSLSAAQDWDGDAPRLDRDVPSRFLVVEPEGRRPLYFGCIRGMARDG